MIVKVEWLDHNRTYSIGLMKFLKLLGHDEDEAKVKKVVKKLLEQNEMD